MPGQGMSFLDAAQLILRERGEPMRGEEIIRIALERRLFTSGARDEQGAYHSLLGSLYSEIRRRPNQRGFTMLGKGMFGLKEWGENQAARDAEPAAAPVGAESARAMSPEPVTVPASEGPSVLDRVVSFSMAGKRFHLTGREALQTARRALAHGLPAGANNYVSWAVDVDGQKVGLKWLFALITGLPSTAFQTNQARPILEDLGLAVCRIEGAAAPDAVPSARRGNHELAAAAMPSVSPSPVALFDSQIASIRSFLNGRADRPNDERLCDWVNFCYEFGLFREGRDLFRLVDPSQVNEWYYERAKRLARVCTMKVAGLA